MVGQGRITVPRATSERGAPIAHAVGRRKSAVARVWCYRGTGNLKINGGQEIDRYFHTHTTRADAILPLTVVPHLANKYDIEVAVKGGGLCAQAGSIRLGIARVLRTLYDGDDTVRSVLREHRLLSVDGRVKERKKYGQKAARRKFQFVKR